MDVQKHITPIVKFHYIRLAYRSLLFLIYGGWYWYTKWQGGGDVWDARQAHPFLFGLIWIVFMLEMLHRLFPSKLESPGCQKQFARNYIPVGLGAAPTEKDLAGGQDLGSGSDVPSDKNRGVFLAAFSWIVLNAVFGVLYLAGAVDNGFLLLLSLAYAVCDLICVLFFCPFRSWMLKNRCCSTCRIYNWDYAMMITPLLFVRTPYTRSLAFLAFVILLRWEITFFLYPQRFFEKTNAYLRCENCREKLCLHKVWQKRVFGHTPKKETKTYDAENLIPVVRCSICNGERVAGFKNIHTGEFKEERFISDEQDLRAFMECYGLDEVRKEY